MNLIYQYYRSEEGVQHKNAVVGVQEQYHLLSKSSIRAYAEKYNHDYKFLDQEVQLSPFYGIFLPFWEGWCHDYDYMCFMDSDMMATVDAEDVFTQADENKITLLHMNTGPLTIGRTSSPPPWRDVGHGNTGVVIFPRNVYEKFIEYLKNIDSLHSECSPKGRRPLGGFDQYIINMFNKEHGFNNLDYKFNYHLGRYKHDDRWDMSLIHYHRKHKNMLFGDYIDNRIIK